MFKRSNRGSAGKFANHAAELASFRHYPLPAPDAFVYLVGGIEIGGGLLLIMGLLTRPAALALAAGMIGAIVISGLARWELISLTLAPLLLVAMISLIRFGAGSCSLDRRSALKAASGHGPPPGDIRHRRIVAGRPCPLPIAHPVTVVASGRSLRLLPHRSPSSLPGQRRRPTRTGQRSDRNRIQITARRIQWQGH